MVSLQELTPVQELPGKQFLDISAEIHASSRTRASKLAILQASNATTSKAAPV
jgi:hypothetical protein